MAASRHDIYEWFLRGRAGAATHMVVVCDTYDHSDYPVYVLPGEDARAVAKEHDGVNMQRVMEVYHLGMDMEAQLAEPRAFHYDLPMAPAEDYLGMCEGPSVTVECEAGCKVFSDGWRHHKTCTHAQLALETVEPAPQLLTDQAIVNLMDSSAPPIPIREEFDRRVHEMIERSSPTHAQMKTLLPESQKRVRGLHRILDRACQRLKRRGLIKFERLSWKAI